MRERRAVVREQLLELLVAYVDISLAPRLLALHPPHCLSNMHCTARTRRATTRSAWSAGGLRLWPSTTASFSMPCAAAHVGSPLTCGRELLFRDIYDKMSQLESAKHAFLELLEPLLLDDKVKSLTPFVMNVGASFEVSGVH